MARIEVIIETDKDADAEPLAFDTRDAATALVVADINVGDGSAELWDGERRLARLRKRGEPGASYWELD